MRSMTLEHQIRYFRYGPSSRLIRAIYCIPTQIKEYKIKLDCVRASFTVLQSWPVHTPVCTLMYGLPLSRSDRRVLSLLQTVYD